MNSHNSAFIFKLAEEFEIPLTPGKQSILEDGDFYSFREKYLAFSKKRDINAAAYLKKTPELFRVYLPYSQRVFNVASNIMWYFDEILTRDPLFNILENVKDDIENQKIELRESLQLLGHFEDLIIRGYMILLSKNIISDSPENIPKFTEELLSRKNIYDALTNAVNCGYELRENTEGQSMGVYGLFLDSGLMYGWDMGNLKLEGQKEVFTPGIRMGEMFNPISFTDLKSKVKNLDKNTFENIFKKEIHRTIRSYKISQELNSVVLFDRKLDSTIISEAKLLDSTNKQAKTVGSLNLILPYIQSIDTQKLVDLRNNMPVSFNDFRAYLVEIIINDLADPNLTQEEIDFITKNKIKPHMKHLEAELRDSMKRTWTMSGTIAAITALGNLTGYHLGVSPSFILGLSAAGAMASLAPFDSLAKTKSKIKLNPLYFLWKASQ